MSLKRSGKTIFTRKNIIGLILSLLGSGLLIFSIINEYMILSFIGLTFLFWGILFLLILPGEYIEINYFNHIINSSILTINDILIQGDYSNYPIYIPVLKNTYLPQLPKIKNEFIFLGKDNTNLDILLKSSLNSEAEGLRISPPGLILTEFYESEFSLDFENVELKDFERVIKNILVDKLEILKKIEVTYEGNTINFELSKYKIRLTPTLSEKTLIINRIGDPVTSSILCILTRVIKKPLLLNEFEYNIGGMKFSCVILNEAEQ